MKTKTINLYSFNELNKKQQQKAIDNLRYINVDYSWWDFIYDDAKTIGLKIEGFDLDRNRGAQGRFLDGGTQVANKILKNHGASCNTYKLAKNFLTEYDSLVEKYSDGKVLCTVAEENVYDFDNDADELESEFLKDLLEAYSIILQKEYEYLTGDAAIIETINANEYTFNSDSEIDS